MATIWLLTAAPVAAQTERPRLVLQVTVDQLRGDLIGRYSEELGEGGFRWLLEHGTAYADAHHAHANTETIVGHTTLSTGAHPSVHGMIGNIWFDRELGRQVYNIEDERYHLLTSGADVDRDTEIDPTQRAARSEGRSPRAIRVTTFGDELALQTAGRARVFGVSVKDRGAVAMAGHAGTAYWFSKATGQWVTSSYYREAYPDWLVALNAEVPGARYADASWELLQEPSQYLFGDSDDQPWETDLPGYGRVFPHAYGAPDSPLFTTLLTVSPAGDEMTLELAKRLIDAEELGADEVPDYLSISFSSTDYVGHLFGPSSLEAEDNLLRLDRTLADLFAFVDERIGLQHVLIVLSADHGTPEAPGTLRAMGVDVDYVNPDDWSTAPAIVALAEQLGVGEALIEGYSHPYISLNWEAIAAADLALDDVQRAVAAALVELPGVAYAVPTCDLVSNALPDTPIYRAILNNYYPSRSGDIYVVLDWQRFMNDFDGLEVAATHGQPWSYDTHVPIIFAGAGVAAQTVYRRVETVDVARTLAAMLGTRPPSGSAGRVLVEVLSPDETCDESTLP